MDDRSFDKLTRSLANGTSRRTVFRSVAGGGLAALLAAIGVGQAEADEVARCDRACRRARRRRRRRKKRTENNTTNGTTINVGNTSLLGNTISPEETLGVVCDGTKATAKFCQSGFCDVATQTCQDCPESQLCGKDDNKSGMVCCVSGSVCADLGCTAPEL